MNSLIINLFWLGTNHLKRFFKILNGHSFASTKWISNKNWSSRAAKKSARSLKRDEEFKGDEDKMELSEALKDWV